VEAEADSKNAMKIGIPRFQNCPLNTRLPLEVRQVITISGGNLEDITGMGTSRINYR